MPKSRPITGILETNCICNKSSLYRPPVFNDCKFAWALLPNKITKPTTYLAELHCVEHCHTFKLLEPLTKEELVEIDKLLQKKEIKINAG